MRRRAARCAATAAALLCSVAGILAALSFTKVDSVTCASIDIRLLTSTTLERLDKKGYDDTWHFSSFSELTNWNSVLKLTCFKNEKFFLAYGGQDTIMYLYNSNDDNDHKLKDDGRHVFRNYLWLYSYAYYKVTEDFTLFGYIRVRDLSHGADTYDLRYRNEGPTFEELFGGARYTYEDLLAEISVGRQWLELGRGFVFYDQLDSLRLKLRYEWPGSLVAIEPILGRCVGDNWDTGMTKNEQNRRYVLAVPGRIDVSAETLGLDLDRFDWLGIHILKPYYAQVFDVSEDQYGDGDSRYNAYYFGSQLYGPLYFEGLMYNLEGILVGGQVNNYQSFTAGDVFAWLADMELLYENQFSLFDYPFPYKSVAGYTVASGDPTAFSTTATRFGNWPDTDSRNFRPISGSYPLKSAVAGFEPTNLRTLHLENWLTCYQSEKYGTVKLGSAFYQFWKVNNRGYISDEDYYTQPRFDNKTSWHVGSEFDGFATYEWRDWFETRFTFGWFVPGTAYPKEKNDPSFLMQTVFTFKF